MPDEPAQAQARTREEAAPGTPRESMPKGLPFRALPLHLFLQIPRAAGTTCRLVFQQMMGGYYFPFEQAAHGAQPGQAAAWEVPGFYDSFLMVGGHAGRMHPLVRGARAASRRLILYAVMRDPVARAVSLYDVVRARPHHPLHGQVAGRSLAAVLRGIAPGARTPWANWQLAQIFGATDPDGIAQALDAENYVIGRLEELPRFLDAVAAFTSIPRPAGIPGEPLAVAERPAGARDQPDFAEATQRLAELNQAEIQFMETRLGPLLLTTSLAPPSGPPHPMPNRAAADRMEPRGGSGDRA